MSIEQLARGMNFVGGQLELATRYEGTLRTCLARIEFSGNLLEARLRWRAYQQFVESGGERRWEWVRYAPRIRAIIRILYSLTLNEKLLVSVSRCYRCAINRHWRIALVSTEGESGVLLQAGDPDNLVLRGDTIVDPRQRNNP